MSYYPILKAPFSKGWTSLANFPPNNWELKSNLSKFVNVTWAESGLWHTKNLTILEAESFLKVTYDDLVNIVPDNSFPFLSLSSELLPEKSKYLPDINDFNTKTPVWRATLGLSTDYSSVSYQGEIDKFHTQGSLLTFCPFIQAKDSVDNYLLFINLEASASHRTAQLEFFDAKNKIIKSKLSVKNNGLTVVSLNEISYKNDDLPVIICRGMSGIPVFYSKTSDGYFLSLEHTHPPASFVIHGKRWEAQKELKKNWFLKVI